MSTTSFHSLGRAMAAERIESTCGGREEARANEFEEAIQLLEDGRWHESFCHLAQLADAAHPQAARIALLLVARGSALFGGSFIATEKQRRAWRLLGQ
jgi:hypothetical protein